MRSQRLLDGTGVPRVDSGAAPHPVGALRAPRDQARCPRPRVARGGEQHREARSESHAGTHSRSRCRSPTCGDERRQRPAENGPGTERGTGAAVGGGTGRGGGGSGERERGRRPGGERSGERGLGALQSEVRVPAARCVRERGGDGVTRPLLRGVGMDVGWTHRGISDTTQGSGVVLRQGGVRKRFFTRGRWAWNGSPWRGYDPELQVLRKRLDTTLRHRVCVLLYGATVGLGDPRGSLPGQDTLSLYSIDISRLSTVTDLFLQPSSPTLRAGQEPTAAQPSSASSAAWDKATQGPITMQRKQHSRGFPPQPHRKGRRWLELHDAAGFTQRSLSVMPRS